MEIRGRFFTAVALRLVAPIDQGFLDAFDARMRQTPKFFENAPFVIDLAGAPEDGDCAALRDLAAALRDRGLSLFGVQNATPGHEVAARELGLIVLHGGGEAPMQRVKREADRRPAPAPAPAPSPTPAAEAPAPDPEPEAPAAPSTLVITEPVRSGQRVYNGAGDIVVIASVGSGAEVVAAGNIHVYGTLRGRALAGVHGDETARIFARSLDAELVAIAGLWKTSDDIADEGRTPRSGPVQAFLKKDALVIEDLA